MATCLPSHNPSKTNESCWVALVKKDDFITDVLLFIFIFTNPSARAGCDTRSIFKRSLTGLNSEFSFSWTSCLTKVEEPSLPDYLSITGGRIIGFIPFPSYVKCYQSRPGFELVSWCPFPTTIIITPWAPPKFSYGLLNMDTPVLANISSVQTHDAVQKLCQELWTIVTDGERVSWNFEVSARLDDDDDDDVYPNHNYS